MSTNIMQFSHSPEMQENLACTNTRCVHHLFEDHARSAPDETAIVFAEKAISYLALNHQANQIAHYLQSLGVGPETRIAICMERSPWMIAAILGTLKAGGTYV